MGNMDNKAELLHNNQVGKKDIYNFKCKKCGKCCYNHTGIIMTPYDLFWTAVKLNTSTEDIVSKYCYRYIGDQSKLPIVSIKAGSCPFHTPTGCMLGEMKPTICRMYPLGRGYIDGKIVYFNQPVTCGDRNHSQTVDDWLKLNDVFVVTDNYFGVVCFVLAADRHSRTVEEVTCRAGVSGKSVRIFFIPDTVTVVC